MWISSLVVTLPSDSKRALAITESLRAIAVITLGEARGVRLPVVIEASDGVTSRYWYQWIESLPGVQHVELAFVSFDESDEALKIDSDGAPSPLAVGCGMPGLFVGEEEAK
ncbi:MAG: hypothetical protein KDA78_07475 [Planctomycetaceae bacterium]|nr:hypothetical protein [Planctomycetaceae bacterium]